MFWGTDDFHHNFMPDNLTVIGEMSGDGEVVCFSNDNGEFMDIMKVILHIEQMIFLRLLTRYLRETVHGVECLRKLWNYL